MGTHKCHHLSFSVMLMIATQLVMNLSQVVGWAFKEERFKQHAQALGLLPAEYSSAAATTTTSSAFNYVGVGVPPSNADKAYAAEAVTRQQFLDNPLGNTGPLCEKRRQRNPHQRQRPSYQKQKTLPWDIVW